MEEGHDRSGEDEFKRQERAGAPDDGDGAGESRHEEEKPLDPDQIEIIGDLGNEFDDPEGWMSERPTYWADRADVPMPTREALIWRRIDELLGIPLVAKATFFHFFRAALEPALIFTGLAILHDTLAMEMHNSQ